MKCEIDKNFYCIINKTNYCFGNSIEHPCIECNYRKLKYITPEQFKEEYGKKWDGLVYFKFDNDDKKWEFAEYENVIALEKEISGELIKICACTPWGKPPDDWR